MTQVLNEANLTNAVLVRSVLTRSDLGGAIIEGADFSDAVLDLPQKQVLWRRKHSMPIPGAEILYAAAGTFSMPSCLRGDGHILFPAAYNK